MSETALNMEPENDGAIEEQTVSDNSANSQEQRDVELYPTAENAQFTDFSQQPPAQSIQRNSMDLLLDVEMNLTVELGRTNLTLKEVLDLTTDSVIELQKQAGEPLDILVNNKLIARGEVVVIDENFGIKITEIVSPSNRMEKTQ